MSTGSVPMVREFPTWQRVWCGTYNSPEVLLEDLTRGGLEIEGQARYCSSRMNLSQLQEEVEIVSVCPEDLGLPEGTTDLSVIIPHARRFRLRLLPAEIAFLLGLKYSDQPVGERLILCMKPFFDSNGGLPVLSIAHYEGRRRLAAYYNGNGGKPDQCSVRRYLFERGGTYFPIWGLSQDDDALLSA